LRVVLDSNVFISALNFGGRPLRLIELLVQTPDAEVFYSDSILGEVLRVLRDKFAWPEEDLQQAKALIATSGVKVTPTWTLNAVPSDPDDNRILECAIEARADVIVTGDGDLLRLQSYRSVRIIKVADLIGEIGLEQQ
jgi:uncharacterized protein